LIDANLIEPQALEIAGWSLLVRPPNESNSKQAIFLNHGWTGNERSMWVFANQLPKDAWLIAPRAPYASMSTEHGGYSWVEDRTIGFSHLDEFSAAKTLFAELLDMISESLQLDLSSFSLIGFSQGAAFNLLFAFDYPQRIKSLASLAGFAPDGSMDRARENSLVGTPVLIAHGTKDETVPVAMAHEARDIMEQAGALVEFCESDVGHKLGANCFADLRRFFAKS